VAYDFSSLAGIDKDFWLRSGMKVYKVVSVLFVSYVSASIVSSGVVLFIIGQSAAPKSRLKSAEATNLSLSKSVNFRDLQKDIEDRNLFNSDGEFPDESVLEEGGATAGADFNEDAACVKTTLSIDLLGTIYLGATGPSLATIKERGYSQADIYRVGDSIIGVDQALVHRIEPKRVILNNAGRKECLELAPPKQASSPLMVSTTGGSEPSSEISGNIVLEEKYVSDELGAGFEKILTKGRLIPHNKNGQMVGFKLIGVKSKSLFKKMGLKNGDIITQVNDISMKQPDQGFALYQAFQDERDIRVSLLRNDQEPMTINVQIK